MVDGVHGAVAPTSSQWRTGSAAEVEIVVKEFAPPRYSKREFEELVNEATEGDHSFLTICMKVGWKHRFRRNLGEFIRLPRLESVEEEEEPRKKEEEKKVSDKDDKFSEDNTKRDLNAIIQLHKERRDGLTEQANKVFGEWCSKGARGRTLW